MPTADGRDVLRTLKGDERTATIPVFIRSGCRELKDRMSALELGADDSAQDLDQEVAGRSLIVALRAPPGRLFLRN